jgi:hypothetical protein
MQLRMGRSRIPRGIANVVRVHALEALSEMTVMSFWGSDTERL